LAVHAHPSTPWGWGLGTIELPNIENPEEPIRTPRDRPAPAGFGPINPEWHQRVDKRGTKYGASWLKNRAPYYAIDFDWTYFNAAPEDQQIDGFLQGDEPLRLQNLIPDQAVLKTRLPGLRIRCFINDRDQQFREVPMDLDTLLVDGDESQVLLTWRGVTQVKDREFDDVTAALIDSEPLSEEPKPLLLWNRELILEHDGARNLISAAEDV
jgi:hypothetical protein